MSDIVENSANNGANTSEVLEVVNTDNANNAGGVVINFTESAVNKVRELIEEEGNPDLKLRVSVTGGGCSGFQYGFTFDEITNEDDFVIGSDGVHFLVDSISYQYLIGAEINYVDSFEGAQFTIKNPKAVTTCGCGSSFSI
jgi:iron-sulfur cluster insertion protein